MLRRILVGMAILGLTACGQGGDAGTPSVDAAGGSAVTPYSATCIEMAAARNWGEATRLCAMALSADPTNEKVKAALATANAALASAPVASDAPSLPSGEAAGEAADAAAEQAEEAPTN